MDSADGPRLSAALAQACTELGEEDPQILFRELVKRGLDRPPLPGSGQTLERWRCLATVAETDLVLAKLYEGHTDALAILDELGCGDFARPGQRWGIWAADPPKRGRDFRRSGIRDNPCSTAERLGAPVQAR